MRNTRKIQNTKYEQEIQNNAIVIQQTLHQQE